MIKSGDRIRLIAMPDDPHPIPPGTTGTVEKVQELHFGRGLETQVHVKWDNGRTLSLIMPPDRVEKI